MATETILQHWIVTKFILPFLLVFFILYGVLEKTKVLGENRQLNALTSFVIGLIFVGAVSPKLVVENMILFFTVAVVVLFIVLLLWGFVSGGEVSLPDSKPLQGLIFGSIVLAVAIALVFVFGVEGAIYNAFFGQSWSGDFWTNAAFIIVIIIAMALLMKPDKS